jgi:sugar phosphate isomerase/epimerase
METAAIKEISKWVFICMPIINLDERYMELVKKNRFDLEILLDFRALDRFSDEYFKKTAKSLLKSGIKTTIHAPFHELFLGAPDSIVRKAVIKRMDAAFKAAEYFKPESVVVHLNFEEKRFRFVYDEWFSHIIPNIKRYAEKCDKIGAFLSVENVYEETPDALMEVLSELKGFPVYHCLDVGHLNAFSKSPLELWLKSLGRYIRQFHLHDNDGTNDTHSPIGTGNIDWGKIRTFISGMDPKPLITLEPHTEEDLWKTFDGFRKAGLLWALET